jgi:RHS repeat-associated protein
MFRKGCRDRLRSHLIGSQSPPGKSRTCFEGPFGELIRATGPMAKANPFRFSTKYQDDETDLLYYGYRYYSASTARWQSRDPKGELAGNNLYQFVVNRPVTHFDYLGLLTASNGVPHNSIRRHRNYLTFTLTCPKDTILVFESVDYSGVLARLHDIGLSDDKLQLAFGKFGGAADLGDEREEKTPNCDGKAVDVTVYMRTRLANQDYLNYLYIRYGLYGFPSVSESATMRAYAEGTVVTYDCVKCRKCLAMPWWP